VKSLTSLLKMDCEVHLDCMPALCPRRRPTYECEAYHPRTQTLVRSSTRTDPEEACAEALAKMMAAREPNV
jgi:hypothetical protein